MRPRSDAGDRIPSNTKYNEQNRNATWFTIGVYFANHQGQSDHHDQCRYACMSLQLRHGALDRWWVMSAAGASPEARRQSVSSACRGAAVPLDAALRNSMADINHSMAKIPVAPRMSCREPHPAISAITATNT
jgi:hypothetical protein